MFAEETFIEYITKITSEKIGEVIDKVSVLILE
jgi:hypothetical protein